MPDQVAQNNRRAVAVLVAFGAVVAVVLAVVLLLVGLGVIGIVAALVVGAGAALWAQRSSERTVLGLSGAHAADLHAHARLHNLVGGLCDASGLAVPRILVIDDPALNALAFGRSASQASLAVTTGLLDALTAIELEAVLAHELSRIRSHDVVPATVAVTTAGLPLLVADRCLRSRRTEPVAPTAANGGGAAGGASSDAAPSTFGGRIGLALLALAPALRRLLLAAAGPSVDCVADLAAIEMTRYPPGLITALEKLEAGATEVAGGTRVTSHLWLAPPVALVDGAGPIVERNRQLDAHPPLAERIATLQEL